MSVRVRFAPSPTGALHIGGIRTALYNYLFARQNGGQLILRIEDTDQTRYVEGAEQYIKDSLKWVGLTLDEGPDQGGPYAPYRQSERKELYREFADRLIANGYAYYAFDTEDELEEMRKRLKAAGVPSPQYNGITRTQMRNSLTLPEDEVRQMLKDGVPYVIRLKVPRKEEVRLQDMIRGWVLVHSAQIDDKVLMKSDGMPTYHLANVVDDHLMKITHVIRGEEWLPSAPLHVLLYRYLGWEEEMPRFAHLPLLLKPDGNGKLSKREADRLGFPIFPLNWSDAQTGEMAIGYRESGYLPEALINFLAFLGWNPGTEQEIFSMDELIKAFSIDRIGKAGAKFDIQKAQWFNQQYLRKLPDAALAKDLLEELKKHGITCTEERAENIVSLVKERATFPQDLYTVSQFFFTVPEVYDARVVDKKWNDDAIRVLEAYAAAVLEKQPSSAEDFRELLEDTTTRLQVQTGKILQALRLSITGMGTGPDLMTVMGILGAEEIAARIRHAIRVLKPQKAQ